MKKINWLLVIWGILTYAGILIVELWAPEWFGEFVWSAFVILFAGILINWIIGGGPKNGGGAPMLLPPPLWLTPSWDVMIIVIIVIALVGLGMIFWAIRGLRKSSPKKTPPRVFKNRGSLKK